MNKLEKTCQYLITKAYTSYSKATCGKCAMAIRTACDFGFETHIKKFPSAKDCAPAYEALGFKKVFSYPEQKKADYKPELGDLAIIQYLPHGHICMKTERGWISDFIQKDMYGGGIRDKDPAFAIYRFNELSNGSKNT